VPIRVVAVQIDIVDEVAEILDITRIGVHSTIRRIGVNGTAWSTWRIVVELWIIHELISKMDSRTRARRDRKRQGLWRRGWPIT
jgi:hypothetical protein